MKSFEPGVFFHEEEKITEVILKDCFTVWSPLAPKIWHFVDLGYDHENNLVGIRIWGDVRFLPTRMEALVNRPKNLSPEEFAAYNAMNGIDK